MKVVNLFKILPKYSNCPDCGSDKLGNGEGKLIVEDTVFIRECKCGFKITLDENGKEIIGG